MRALDSEKSLREQRKKKTIVLSLLMLAIMVASTAGYAFLSQTDKKENSAKNEEIEGKWVLPAGDRSLVFSNAPTSVQHIPVDISAVFDEYVQKPLYIVADKKEVIDEIASTLGVYVGRIQRACYEKCEEDFPEKTCNISAGENIIIFKSGTQEKVFEQENCVFIEGNLSSVDAFLYRLFGVNF